MKLIRDVALGLLALRAWFLSTSQYRGYEWVILFLGIVYLWTILRIGILDEGRGLGPRRVTRPDTAIAVLTALLFGIVAIGTPA